jgi:hypothetical protein
MRRYPALPLQTEEGICELFAWLWLGGGGGRTNGRDVKSGGSGGGRSGGGGTINGEDETQNARRRRLMEERVDPVYGDGFRLAKKALDACGGDLGRLLEHVLRQKGFP